MFFQFAIVGLEFVFAPGFCLISCFFFFFFLPSDSSADDDEVVECDNCGISVHEGLLFPSSFSLS
jgi:hypothetical protein